MGCHMANPSEVFRAMAYEDPYPIKDFLRSVTSHS